MHVGQFPLVPNLVVDLSFQTGNTKPLACFTAVAIRMISKNYNGTFIADDMDFDLISN